MKPRHKAGKAATGGRRARAAIAQSKPLSEAQLKHLGEEKPTDAMSTKAGRKGKRAHWDIDYAEGVEFDMKPMPWREPESFTIDGVRRWPKKGG